MIVVVFLLSTTQAFIAFLLAAIYAGKVPSSIQTYLHFVFMMVMLNAALNFFVFYFFGAKFRKLLQQFVTCKQFSKRSNGLCKSAAGSSNTPSDV